MIGLDTNVLVRYLAQDDIAQARVATRLIELELSATKPGFVSLVVLVELCWVLKRLYSATESELVDTLANLLAASHFHLERRDVVQTTVQRMRASKSRKASIPDMLVVLVAAAQGCTHTVSFDKGAVQAAGMVLLV
jgi:predicted nucleic-acid-binding protein